MKSDGRRAFTRLPIRLLAGQLMEHLRGSMFDPISVVGAAALTQAVTFLYGQLTDVLRRRRERADEQVERGTETSGEVSIHEVPAGVLDGPLPAVTVSPEVLERAEVEMLQLRGLLGEYADGIRRVEPTDARMAEAAAKARGLLETLYGRRLTFAGEMGRATTGTVISPAEMDSRVGAITASGTGAIAAHTIGAPTATSGGVAAGTISGNVSTGGSPPNGTPTDGPLDE